MDENAQKPLSIKREIQKYRTRYDKLRPVISPAIGEKVYFNSRGFKHLIYKGGHRRNNAVIRSRLVLIPLIVPAIKNCPAEAEIRIRNEKIRGKDIRVVYYALEAEVGVNPIKVRIIIRKEGTGGKFYFQSIMQRN